MKTFDLLNMSVWSLITVLVAVLFSVESRKIVDLTHTLDKDAPHWPFRSVTKDFVYYNMSPVLKQYFGDMW